MNAQHQFYIYGKSGRLIATWTVTNREDGIAVGKALAKEGFAIEVLTTNMVGQRPGEQCLQTFEEFSQ